MDFNRSNVLLCTAASRSFFILCILFLSLSYASCCLQGTITIIIALLLVISAVVISYPHGIRHDHITMDGSNHQTPKWIFYAAHFSSGFDHLSLKSILCINAEFFMLHIYQSPMMIYCTLHIHQTWLAGKSSEFTSMIRHDSPNETKP